ncbi:hypothetical protein [endosymbiont GvMRE of Glomus versiforme]|uniref:hypothetical protein n=1 Tax=endosymbiont GvMRE of Glomus versiforme TaxID=2039283 RepID=UPI000EC173DB|nr:hypothetical protein [endosymbiont GvMRE of Glomus versiforme]RHZ35596.1 Late protein [endosymbiont GvMRE of Glomus versiforme]
MKFSIVVLVVLTLVSVVSAINLEKRRFGQEHTSQADACFQNMKDLSSGTGFEAELGNLSGAAVRALLAKAPACDQQDIADLTIDIARRIGQNERKGKLFIVVIFFA